jgi:hypothetical protein
MKKIITVISVQSTVPNRSGIPDEAPLMSVQVLKAYALTLVDVLEGSVYAPSLSGTSQFQVGYSDQDADPEKMAAVASEQKLAFTVDPLEYIHSWMYYNGTIGNNRFALLWREDISPIGEGWLACAGRCLSD